MNKKKFFDFVFFMVGTFIVLTVGIIVSLNFYKDASIFNRPVVAAAGDSTPKPTVTPEPPKPNSQMESSGTFKYERKVDPTPKPTEKPKDYGESMPPKEQSDSVKEGTQKEETNKEGTAKETTVKGTTEKDTTTKETTSKEATSKETTTTTKDATTKDTTTKDATIKDTTKDSTVKDNTNKTSGVN